MITPKPYRDANDHPYCSLQCDAWRAQRADMPKFCVVIRASPKMMAHLDGAMCLPIIDQLCRAARKESE